MLLLLLFFILYHERAPITDRQGKGPNQGCKRINIKIMLMFARGESRRAQVRPGMGLGQAQALKAGYRV